LQLQWKINSKFVNFNSLILGIALKISENCCFLDGELFLFYIHAGIKNTKAGSPI